MVYSIQVLIILNFLSILIAIEEEILMIKEVYLDLCIVYEVS